MNKADLIEMILGGSSTKNNSAALEELRKLDIMLIKADIPHKYWPRQICYYGKNEPPKSKPGEYVGPGWGAVCSVIADGYGCEEGLLEIKGLMTDEECQRVHNTVLGHLTAENIFARIKAHWDSIA